MVDACRNGRCSGCADYKSRPSPCSGVLNPCPDRAPLMAAAMSAEVAVVEHKKRTLQVFLSNLQAPMPEDFEVRKPRADEERRAEPLAEPEGEDYG